MNGIINFHKPQHVTSHDCVALIRRLTGIKRVGHTGTLDPMATGVLPICIGTATRVTEYLDQDEKTYRCTMQLGIETDTQDIWGQILRERPVENLSPDRISEAVFSFQGDVIQIPPKYSALKVNGKRLYEYARAGQDVEIKSRHIYISTMTLDNIHDNQITFTATCSKGTYVRTLCQDIGEKLGCGGTMTSLARLATGMFRIEDAFTSETLKSMNKEEIERVLTPVDATMDRFAPIYLDQQVARDFTNGKRIMMPEEITKNLESVSDFLTSDPQFDDSAHLVRVYYKSEFIGVGRLTGNFLTADKVFNTRLQHEGI
jgi:tRNA pseudouridine55 synthase